MHSRGAPRMAFKIIRTFVLIWYVVHSSRAELFAVASVSGWSLSLYFTAGGRIVIWDLVNLTGTRSPDVWHCDRKACHLDRSCRRKSTIPSGVWADSENRPRVQVPIRVGREASCHLLHHSLHGTWEFSLGGPLMESPLTSVIIQWDVNCKPLISLSLLGPIEPADKRNPFFSRHFVFALNTVWIMSLVLQAGSVVG